MPTDSKFPLGRIVATPDALEELSQSDILTALRRHASGDWGDCDQEDRNENNFSLKEGFRILSVYYSARRKKFWIITEANRSITTVLLPENY